MSGEDKDYIDNPELVKRIEEIMLAEDQGRLPFTQRTSLRMMTVPVDPDAQAAAIAKRIEHYQALTRKMKQLTEQWFPSAMQRNVSWQWTSYLGQGCRVSVDDYVLYIEVRPDLSVLLFMQWPSVSEGAGPLEEKLTRDTKIFHAQDPVECIIEVMRPMASRFMSADLARQLTRIMPVRQIRASYTVEPHELRTGKIGTLYGVSFISAPYDPVAAARFFRVQTQALYRYYNRRKKQKRARTGRRSK